MRCEAAGRKSGDLKAVLPMKPIAKITVLVVALCVGLAWLGGRGCHAESNGRASASATVQTDLAALRKQIVVPDGVSEARWAFRQIQDDSWVPSPGSAILIVEMRLSPDATRRLLETGTWIDSDQSPEVLTPIRQSSTPTGRLLRSTAAEPGDSVIRRTTWMKVELWIDADAKLLFAALEKS